MKASEHEIMSTVGTVSKGTLKERERFSALLESFGQRQAQQILTSGMNF